MNKLSADQVHPGSNDLSGREADNTSTQVVEKGGGESPQHVAVEQPEAKDGKRQLRFAGPIRTSEKGGDHAHDLGSRGHGHDHDGLAEPLLAVIESESESENDGERKSPWH